MRQENEIANDWDWSSPIYHMGRFSRLPKLKLRMLAWTSKGAFPKIFRPETTDTDLSWLAVDLMILTFGNTLNYEFFKNPDIIPSLLEIWKEHIASRPQLGFCEITRPDKITTEIAVYAQSKLMENTFFKEVFFPELMVEMYRAYHDPNYYRNLDPSPIERSTTYMFLRDYMRDSDD